MKDEKLIKKDKEYTYLRNILSIPSASERCTGSTDLRVAMTFGIDDMKVKNTLTKMVTMNQAM